MGSNSQKGKFRVAVNKRLHWSKLTTPYCIKLIKGNKDGLSSVLHNAWEHPTAPGGLFPKGSSLSRFYCEEERTAGLAEGERLEKHPFPGPHVRNL